MSEMGSSRRVVEHPTNIVYFVIHDQQYRINVSMMHSVFQQAADPVRIYIFEKNGQQQGFCEFSSAEEAQKVAPLLNGRFMFPGNLNRLSVRTTDRASMTVKYNNELSWDYTQELPSTGPGDHSVNAPVAGSLVPYNAGGPPGKGGGRAGWGAVAGAGPGSGQPCTTSVLMVVGIPGHVNAVGERSMTTDALFVLIGCYADVIRVVFLRDDSKALVQCASVEHAECARVHLDGLRLLGSNLKVYGAHNAEVQLTGGPDRFKQWDYTGSPLHRFVNPRNVENIASPKPALMVWGCMENWDEADVVALFYPYGTVEAVKRVAATRQARGGMYCVQLESTEQAVLALCALHGTKASESLGVTLRLNFAKEFLHQPGADVVTVRVRNFPAYWNDSDLQGLVQPFAPVTRAKVHRDLTTGESKGLGVVEVCGPAAARAVHTALHGNLIPGCTTPLDISHRVGF
eukprot:TRINITY_DN50944_c0_g1_i1.p1 TRINITY_DN50944_c0_g1~~TRINITY_DN50944_c0_g1_i1.p1  ORF type:complete len:487 (+),score=116.27 TRINITY_DN50944_c0_g1_i1:88-1461(+)